MLLVTEHLTKDYGRYRALDDLNLQVRAGEVFGILGPNGSGKSTTLRLLMGFLRPTLGRASIAGHDCWRESVAVRRLVTYLPGELRLYENLTGRQLLKFLAGIRNHAPGPRVEQLARRLDIDLDKPIASFSSGMKRKLALLQVLVPKVPLLILDEPTNTLDPSMRDELLDQLLQAKAEGKAVLFSSHVLQEVERVCDRVAILSKGKLAHVQEMKELREARLARVRFAGRPSWAGSEGKAGTSPPTPEGIVVQAQKDGELLLECRGEMRRLLQWLAGQPVADVQIEPLGLKAVYQKYHG